jgi:hypothetical protein
LCAVNNEQKKIWVLAAGFASIPKPSIQRGEDDVDVLITELARSLYMYCIYLDYCKTLALVILLCNQSDGIQSSVHWNRIISEG